MGYTYRGTIRDVEPEKVRTPSTPGPKPTTPVFDPEKCGTYAGYRQHQKHDEPACQDCKGAVADYASDYYQRRKNGQTPPRKFNPSACGTYPGYHRHKRSNVPVCDPCRAAVAQYRRAARKVAA